MCGIAAVLTSRSRGCEAQLLARRMGDSLHHRGPDDRGLFISQQRRCALAHTRLAIIDLSAAGHQPMTTTDCRYTLMLNGEIYNFPALRAELQQRGVEFRSHSDTEVVLELFAREGAAGLKRLRGMFALCVWDEATQQLLIARDRQGIKPLYYYADHELFLCASEVRTLLASHCLQSKLSPEGLAGYLRFGSVQEPWTLVDGVKSVPPGHCITVKRGADHLQTKIFSFGTEPMTEPYSLTRTAAVDELRSVLSDSVRQHLVSDVPLGVFLSGGIDSTALVALIQQVSGTTPKTFNVTFAEDEFNEGAHARLIAQRFSTDHREIPLTEREFVAEMPGALAAMDQPTMDGINTYILAKAVRQAGIKVALSGLGGDELFAGYPSFHRARRLRHLTKVPKRMRQSVATVGRALAAPSPRQEKFWLLLACDGSAREVYQISRQLFSRDETNALCPALATLQEESGDPCGFDAVDDPINRISFLESRGYMTNTLLRDTDQMSMAHGLEIRVPFVDTAVEQLVCRLPGTWKMDQRRPKPLLLDAVPGSIPGAVWRRPKMGFTLPFQRWMLSALRSEVDESLADPAPLRALGLDATATASVWREFINDPKGVPWSRPWSLHVLARWCNAHGITL